jgi:hypothetical protein
VGRAGKMLDRLLNEEGLPRERIMITKHASHTWNRNCRIGS